MKKFFDSMTIGAKFNLFIAIISVVIIAMGFLGYKASYCNLSKGVINEMLAISESEANRLDSWLSKKLAVALAQANILSAFHGDQTYIKNRDIFVGGIHDEDILDIGAGFEDGEYISNKWGVQPFDVRQRYWYIGAKNTKNHYITTSSYIDTLSGKEVVSFAVPIRRDTQFIGVVCEDIDVLELDKQVSKIKYHNNVGDAILFDGNGKIISSSNDIYLKNGHIRSVISEDIYKELSMADNWENNIIFDNKEYVVGYATLDICDWSILFLVPYDYIFKEVFKLRIFYTILTLLAILIATVFSIRLCKRITLPMLRLTASVEKLADGDLSQNFPEIEGKCEVCRLVKALKRLQNKLINIINKD